MDKLNVFMNNDVGVRNFDDFSGISMIGCGRRRMDVYDVSKARG